MMLVSKWRSKNFEVYSVYTLCTVDTKTKTLDLIISVQTVSVLAFSFYKL